MTIHPSKVFYTLDTQEARYLDGYLGVYRPAIGPGRYTTDDKDESAAPPRKGGKFVIPAKRDDLANLTHKHVGGK